MSALLFAALLAFVVGNVLEDVINPMWYNSMAAAAPAAGVSPDNVNMFVMFLVQMAVLPVVFVAGALAIRAGARARGLAPRPSLLRVFGFAEHRAIAVAAFALAAQGVLIVPASRPDRVPPVVEVLINCTMVIPLVALRHLAGGVARGTPTRTSSPASSCPPPRRTPSCSPSWPTAPGPRTGSCGGSSGSSG